MQVFYPPNVYIVNIVRKVYIIPEFVRLRSGLMGRLGYVLLV